MKGHPKIVAMLNLRLSEEHTAIQQYRTHSAMCKNWGYKELAEYLAKRADDEKEHTEEIMERILFLGGIVDFSAIGEVKVGENVGEMFLLDQESEASAIAGYTDSIKLCVELEDFGTRTLMEHILLEETSHLSVIEENIQQITDIGIGCYLATKIGG